MRFRVAARGLRESLGNASRLRTRQIHASPIWRDQYLNASPEQFRKSIAQADKTVIVDFYADWCGPCKLLTPILKDESSKPPYSKTVDLLTIDTDAEENASLAVQYKVSSLPTVIAFRQGKPVDQFIGAIPADRVQAWLKKIETQS